MSGSPANIDKQLISERAINKFSYPAPEDSLFDVYLIKALELVHNKYYGFTGLAAVVSSTPLDPIEVVDTASIDGAVWEITTARGNRLLYSVDTDDDAEGCYVVISFLTLMHFGQTHKDITKAFLEKKP